MHGLSDSLPQYSLFSQRLIALSEVAALSSANPFHKHCIIPRAVEVAVLHVGSSYAKSFIVGVQKKNKESSDHLHKLRWFIMPIAVKQKINK